MQNAILHIGLSKVGSSSLQQSCSQVPIQSMINSEAKARYISINVRGEVLEGKDLYYQAKNTVKKKRKKHKII